MDHLDLAVFHAINVWCGTPILDWLAIFADRTTILKGGVSIAAFWWFWFHPPSQNRRLIIASLLGACFAIVISRALASGLPFRIRPRYAEGIDYHPPSTPMLFNDQEDWSSFPSDHAAMWFALAFGLWKLSRPTGIFFLIYASIWICLPRLYLGIHYPSDMVVGAVIGLLSGWTISRLPLTAIMRPVLLIERRWPEWFYTAAFLVTYEMASIFDDVRKVMHGMRLIVGHQTSLTAMLFVLCAVAAIGITMIWFWLYVMGSRARDR